MTYLQQPRRIVELPVEEMKQLFNALEIAKKGREGVLQRKPEWTGQRRPRHLRVGSRSKTWSYTVPHNGWKLAIAHIYLERGIPRGAPDPKVMWIDEVIFKLAD